MVLLPKFSLSVEVPKNFPEGALWVHAPSVGEFNTAKPLLELFKEQNTPIVLTFSSPRAEDYLKKQSLPDWVLPLPLPLGFFIDRFVKRVKPRVLLIVESDRYPALLGASVPFKAVVNARISERSFKNIKRFPFLKNALRGVDKYLCKSERDCALFRALGVPEERLIPCGNLKAVMPQRLEGIKPPLRFPKGRFVLVLGSTHGGEEKELLRALRVLFGRIKTLAVVVAPRHTARAGEVFRLLKGAFPKKRIQLRSEVKGNTFEGDILVVDTLGELLGFYSVCDAAFVGGSLVPIGGHNLLEPAYFGKPVFYGPFVEKFGDLEEILREMGLAFPIGGAEGLVEGVLSVFKNPPKAAFDLKEYGRKILECYERELQPVYNPSAG